MPILQNAMVFKLDDKQIAGIESTLGVVIGFCVFIALNFIWNKNKKKEMSHLIMQFFYWGYLKD